MADDQPIPFGSREATPAESRWCAKAIDQDHPDAIPPGTLPAEVYVAEDKGRKMFYVNVVARQDVPTGTVYRTWIVSTTKSGKPRISWFLSRRGERGDTTLPPSDDGSDTLPP